MQDEELYEAFLNFRGSDTRQTTVDVLYHCLKDIGVRVFIDSKGLHTGNHIQDLFRHIEACNIYVTVFSENYAESRWCLEELAHMVEMEKASEDRRILPIFFDVTPGNVKLNEAGYRDVIASKIVEYGKQKVNRWEDALRYVGGISGKPLGDQGVTFIGKSIAEEILTMVKQQRENHALHVVKNQVKEVVDKLRTGIGDAQYLVIHGKPGIGKTTLVKLVSNQLSPDFQETLFLEDTEEASDGHAADEKVWNEGQYCRSKVLIVLDDINGWEKIEELASKFTCFGHGSRIIITTSAERLPLIENVCAFEMREMECEAALEFFCWHALGRSSPPREDYMILAVDAVNLMELLPLGLEILGSFLHRKPKNVWEHTITQLKRGTANVESAFQKMLEIVYNSLDDKAKKIFLDTACFFVNKEKTNPTYMWRGALLNDGVKVLLNLSLIKDTDDNKLWMHNQIREFGRNIVQLECRDYMERSRFWQHDKALEVLRSTKLIKNAQAICLSNDESSLGGCTLGKEEFRGLQNLRFIQLHRAIFSGDLNGILQDLRWLSWHHCPCSLPATKLWGLAILDLSWSCIDDQWQGWQHMRNLRILKVLNLTGCNNLTRTSELSGCPLLERLILQDCKRLATIDSSIGKLKSLKYLNVKGCDSLLGFPREMHTLVSLTELVIGVENTKLLTIASRDQILGPRLTSGNYRTACLSLAVRELRNSSTSSQLRI